MNQMSGWWQCRREGFLRGCETEPELQEEDDLMRFEYREHGDQVDLGQVDDAEWRNLAHG